MCSSLHITELDHGAPECGVVWYCMHLYGIMIHIYVKLVITYCPVWVSIWINKIMKPPWVQWNT